MEMLKNAISWVEIPVTDFERARNFYSQIYDYEMPEMNVGSNRIGILLYDQMNGGIGGAIVKGEGYEPTNKGTKIYLNGGQDLSAVLNRVEKCGGKVIMPKIQISPELGFFATFQDTEGNTISLHSMN